MLWLWLWLRWVVLVLVMNHSLRQGHNVLGGQVGHRYKSCLTLTIHAKNAREYKHTYITISFVT